MSDFLRNRDIATEILSRLSTKELGSARCVSKAWNSFISDPAFLRIHSQRWTCPSALFFVIRERSGAGFRSYFHVKKAIYIGLHDSSSKGQESLFRFLPERVVLMASSNGILCCRGMVPSVRIKNCDPDGEPRLELHFMIYVCNPATREWVAFEPLRTGNSSVAFEPVRISSVAQYFGFTFYPTGFLANTTKPCFKVVGIQNSKTLSNSYSFVIYSSVTKEWKTSEEVLCCDYTINQNKVISVGHMFHWLTMAHYMITFDVEKELSAVIKLPGPELEKDTLSLISLLPRLERREPETDTGVNLIALAFHEEILCMLVRPEKLFSYSFNTRKLNSHCTAFAVDDYFQRYPAIPYSDSLTSINVPEGDQTSGANSNGI
ncbi:F-BOX PROTEIN INTERACTION DOMAIN PROTEIN [Salix viminalis]|uniref:F-BOX PROTEIN INTERACTION DOMAIN PROTEIN n=1 Tax=Salix viminalis TaxID=40686 RepID=A0A9Q0NT78_SALVM|nr:F-BOX PROTEIN INTERACTION DOMAIN PROTEIN [Salix viminalis]